MFGRRAAAVGAVAGGLKFKEAQTSMLVADARSGVQVAAAEGSTKKESLFDLSNDEGEKVDLSTQHPDVLARIRAEFLAWNARMLPKLPPS